MGEESPKPASTPRGAVFLSYASQDAEAARRICEALRAGGIEVWFDQSELRGGDVWDRQIRAQIHECRLFMPIVSANSEARLEGYFRREWKLAVDRTHDLSERVSFLVPVVIDSTSELKADVPDAFRHVQWTRLPGGQASSAFVERVRQLLAPGVVSEPVTAAHNPPGLGRRYVSAPAIQAVWGQKPAVWVLAAVVAVAIAYFGVDKFWLSRHRASSSTSSALTSGAAARFAPEKSIAVLPFVDMSEKKDQAYFADGIAEEIIDLLAKIHGLRVIGRTSSFQFRDKTDDLPSISAKLGVKYVLEGSVRRAGERARVTAQLIKATDGSHVWSETYERLFGDLFAIQDDITANLVRALQVELLDSAVPSPTATQDGRVLELVLRARHARDRADPEGWKQAAAYLEETLRLDPGFAPAAADLAVAYASFGFLGIQEQSKAFALARGEAHKALQLDPNNGGLVALLARMHWYDRQWPLGDLELARALKLAPQDPDVLHEAAFRASSRGDSDSALVLIHRALANDPLNPVLNFALGDILLYAGRLADAEVALRRTLEISPTHVWARYSLGQALFAAGRIEEAAAMFEQTKAPEARQVGAIAVAFALGRKQESAAAMRRFEAEWGDHEPYEVAQAHAYREEMAQAMPWLYRAAERFDVWVPECRGDPAFAKFANDPAYRKWLHSIGLLE